MVVRANCDDDTATSPRPTSTPAGSAVDAVTISDEAFEVTAGFVEVGGNPLAPVPGTLRVACPSAGN